MPGKSTSRTPAPERVAVRKTYKLYIGGAFPRSESGRSYPVTGPDGTLLAHAAQASRKDLRDAVTAARKAFAGWSRATAYNRGQVLYRIAEMLEGRREQFVAEIVAAEGGTSAQAAAQVDAAIDRWVWYAGWSDKYAQVVGGANPVAGPYFNFSLPEPSGVVVHRIEAMGDGFAVERDDDGAFRVRGKRIERIAAQTNFDVEESAERFQRDLRRYGIEAELRRAGIVNGDLVRIGATELEWGHDRWEEER